MRKCKRHSFDPWVGKIPGSRNGNLLQYSYLENLMDRGAWWATVHRVAKSQTQLSDWTQVYKVGIITIIIIINFSSFPDEETKAEEN